MFGLNPWALLGALAFLFVSVGGAYFYGHDQGVKSEKAALADKYQSALDKFAHDVTKAAAAATADALKDFKAKTAVLEELAGQLKTAQGVMNVASSKLAASLRGGACVLSPVQRQLLECVRRPGSAGCAAGSSPGG